jgi:plastocyanin
MHRIALAWLFVSLALVVGCTSSPTSPSDAGTDAGASPDGAADAGADGGADAAIDAGVDAGGGADAGDIDAGGGADANAVDGGTMPDAGGTDAGSVDAGTDAGHDAGTDGGTDAGTDAGVLTVNGCTAATAEDHTGMSSVTIDFGGVAGLTYTPRCIRVRAGTRVTFNGSFSFHPLQAGTVSGAVATPAAAGTTPLPTSPVSTGTTASFVVAPVGAYGYYCTLHATFGMNGAIFVE